MLGPLLPSQLVAYAPVLKLAEGDECLAEELVALLFGAADALADPIRVSLAVSALPALGVWDVAR